MSYDTWTTKNELEFLKRVGSWLRIGQHRYPPFAPSPRAHRYTLDCLRNYRDAMRLRSDWCGMDQQEIRRYVDEQIVYLERLTKNDEQKGQVANG